MEFRRLNYFVAVAEEENITRAAGRLRVAQPALSRQIRALEDDLGVPLFEHGARSIRLTAAGRHFLPKALDLLRRLEKVIDEVRVFQNQENMQLEVGYVPSLTKSILPEILEELRRSFPGLRVTLHDLNTEEMATGLYDGSLHVALMVRPSGRPMDGITYTEISSHLPCVVMSPKHPLASVAELETSQVAHQPLVAFSRNGYPEHHAWLAAIFGKEATLSVAAECDTVGSMLVLLESGVGLALVQEGFEELSVGRVVARPLKNAARFAFSFGVSRRSGDTNPVVARFIELTAALCPGVDESDKVRAAADPAGSMR